MTWDEMVEVACEGAYGKGWRGLAPEWERRCRDAQSAALRALRAAGVVQVPAEPTEAMIAAAEFNGPLDPMADALTRISAALSAGQIKPEGE